VASPVGGLAVLAAALAEGVTPLAVAPAPVGKAVGLAA
jgi:hypothetical protein